MKFLRLSFLFGYEALVEMEIIVRVPGNPGHECAGPAVGPWADPSRASLSDLVYQVFACQVGEAEMRSCF